MQPFLCLVALFLADGASASSHLIVPGKYSSSYWADFVEEDYQLCTDDSSSQSAVKSLNWGHDIAVGCCEVDGSGASRPGCAQSVTYEEAVQICDTANMRLCTLQEMLWDEITAGTVCYYGL